MREDQVRRRGRGAGKGGQGGCGSEARDGESRERHLELVHSPAVARYTDYPRHPPKRCISVCQGLRAGERDPS